MDTTGSASLMADTFIETAGGSEPGSSELVEFIYDFCTCSAAGWDVPSVVDEICDALGVDSGDLGEKEDEEAERDRSAIELIVSIVGEVTSV